MKEAYIRKGPRYLYTLLYYGLVPFILLRLLWRGHKAPGYLERWRERFGFVPPEIDGKNIIWIHAVSVGETLAALPLIRVLQQQSDQKILVTTTTPTGSERVKATLGDSVYHMYAPYDLPGAINRVVKTVKPNMLIVMETELWPNLVNSCYQQGIPVVIANARLSERSARGYGRVRFLIRPMLQQLTRIAVQTAPEKERFIALGAQEEQVSVTGNIKFDVQLSADLRQQAADLKQALVGIERRPILLAASTHQGEDEILLDAYGQLQKQFQNLLLVIAPRHPERFPEVGRIAEGRGFSVAKRSLAEIPSEQQQVLLCDTMGELLLFYGACDIAFVGGSLVPVGGHNMMEPAAWQAPIISGPHLFNFSEASQLLSQANALVICADSDEIIETAALLLADEECRQQKGKAALEVIQNNQGALQRVQQVIQNELAGPKGEQMP